MPGMSAAQMIALVREGLAEGLTEFAEFVHDETLPRTPDDPATSGDDLPGSLTVDPATPDDLQAAVYTNAAHAVYQHESLDLQHPNGGQAKYLESAALESAGEGERIMAAALRRKLS